MDELNDVVEKIDNLPDDVKVGVIELHIQKTKRFS